MPRALRLSAALLAAAPLACVPANPPPPSPPVEIVVYAAASLEEAMTAIAPLAESEIRVAPRFQFGATNDLVRQIEAAGKADVFLSADEEWMDRLERAGLLDAPSRIALLSNRLVVLVPASSSVAVAGAADLAAPSFARIALADPEVVPAGRYARGWLASAGVWESLRDRIVPALDVRAAVGAVESGGVDAAVVYRTEGMRARGSKIAYLVPEEDAPPISYPAAAMARRPQLDASRRFVSWLRTDRPAAVFRRAGFVVRSPSSP